MDLELDFKLPEMRTDLELALQDFDDYGMARISGLFSAEEIANIKCSVSKVAEDERLNGTALIGGADGPDDTPSQRVYGLVYKSEICRSIVLHPILLKAAARVLQDKIMLYAFQAHMIGRGGDMPLHTDQGYMPIQHDGTFIFTAIIMVDEFTDTNGATIAIPGSQNWNRPPTPEETKKATPITGPAGTVMLFGGKLWHGVGVNRSNHTRHGLVLSYSKNWLQTFENATKIRTLDEIETYPTELQSLLGISHEQFGTPFGLRRAEMQAYLERLGGPGGNNL
jgi:hypothetical protein